MTPFIASTFVSGGSLWLYIDNNVVLKNSNNATVELEEEGEYIVHWLVMGSPGSSYSITISSPREAQFQLTRVLGIAGKDFGGFRYKS